jgi:tetratricopeptide (TPR) repeat protein
MKTAARRRLLPIQGCVMFVALFVELSCSRFEPSPSHLERAEAAYAEGDYDSASRLAREHLTLRDADDPNALRVLARSWSRSGREEDALPIFERRLGPDAMQAEDLYLLGVAFDRRGQPDLALDTWNRALEDDPDHAETLAALVYLYSRGKRLDEARLAAERLAGIPGWESQGELMLGVALAESNDPEGAAEWLGLALRHDPPPPGFLASPDRYRFLFARSALRLGRPDDAIGPLRDVLATSPSAEASWLLSRAELQRGNIESVNSLIVDASTYRASHPLEPEPSPYVGEARCTECHPGIAQEAATSRHSRTLHRGGALLALPLPDSPLPDPDEPGVSHRIERVGSTLEVETQVDGRSFRSIIEAAFGDPDRYVTMVSRDDSGNYRTLRHSYYQSDSGSGWDRSLGDTGRPDRLANALGRPADSRDGVVRCLACHTTNVRFGEHRIGPETADAGIGCEHCHGPGANHLAAVSAGLTDLAIVNPALASTIAVTDSCSSCHILDSETASLPSSRADPAWIRSQGKTLSWSRCFTETGGAIGCVSCHDPHQPTNTSASHYESVCVSCHAPSRDLAPRLPAGSPLAICPIEPARSCVSCHMPEVDVPAMHASLTDHFIRIVVDQPTESD